MKGFNSTIKKCMIIVIGLIIFLCCSKGVCAYKVCEDTVITSSVKDGIRVVRSCTLRFENVGDITIGNSDNVCSGIELDPGVELVLNLASYGDVGVYGGYYFKDGNEYNCAGIYVPPTSTLIINSEGIGNLLVYSFDRGAGIGGHGVLIENFNENINCQDAGKVVIKNGGVIIGSPVEYSGYARGAGIGGGGVLNVNTDTKRLIGGSLNTFQIQGGFLTIVMSEVVDSYGQGAAIGGGGIANLNGTVDKIRGGNASNIFMDDGLIRIHNRKNMKCMGMGSVIGGGGIYNISEACIIEKGELICLRDAQKAKVYSGDESEIYGNGGVYNKGSFIRRSMQKQDVVSYKDGFNCKCTSSIVNLGMIFSALFMLFELTT